MRTHAFAMSASHSAGHIRESTLDPLRNTEMLQAPLSVVDDNRKVVGALSVVGATIVKIVSKFQYYFPDFLKKIRISVNQLGFPGIPAKFREIFTEK